MAAAGELGVSPAAVSQLIRSLEDQIGRKLFHRINRRIVLTEAGREILPRLLTAFEELRGVSMDLTGTEHRSRLVVSVPPSMASGWLPSRLPRFIARHGPVDIALRGEVDPVPFERELIDLRLSYGRFHHAEHAVEEIGTDAVYPVCAPELLRKFPSVAAPEDLLAMPLIHTDWGPSAASFPAWRNWFQSHQPDLDRDIRKGLSADASRTALELALNGLGVALGQGLYAADPIAAGQLVMPVRHGLRLGQPYYLTMTARSLRRPAAAAFRDWFLAECREAIHAPHLAIRR